MLKNLGKGKKHETGTLIVIPCPKDGTEVIPKLEDYMWSTEDDIIIDKLPIIGNYFKDIHLIDRGNYINVATIIEGGFTQTDTDQRNFYVTG